MDSVELFLNKASFGRSAKRKMIKIAPEYSDVGGYNPDELNIEYRRFLKSEAQAVIIAGGDGTIHHFINQVWTEKPDLLLGVIGVGSSNSLLRSRADILTKACRAIKNPKLCFTAFNSCEKIDLGRLTLVEANRYNSRYFIANASIGFLAEANKVFNAERGLLKMLKKISTEVSNTWVFFKTWFSFGPPRLRIEMDETIIESDFLNVQILKAHFYSGNFHFQTQNSLNSGLFEVHLFLYKSKWQTLLTFLALSLNHPEWVSGHQVYLARTIKVDSPKDFLVEADGEIYEAGSANFECLKQKLNLAGPI